MNTKHAALFDLQMYTKEGVWTFSSASSKDFSGKNKCNPKIFGDYSETIIWCFVCFGSRSKVVAPSSYSANHNSSGSGTQRFGSSSSFKVGSTFPPPYTRPIRVSESRPNNHVYVARQCGQTQLMDCIDLLTPARKLVNRHSWNGRSLCFLWGFTRRSVVFSPVSRVKGYGFYEIKSEIERDRLKIDRRIWLVATLSITNQKYSFSRIQFCDGKSTLLWLHLLVVNFHSLGTILAIRSNMNKN